MTVLVVMGVSGAGKTTIGQALARRLACAFVEGDGFHTRVNREKMREGIPLTDADREPWIESLRSRVAALEARGASAVMSCSALRKAHRDILRRAGARFIFLKVTPEVARARLARRRGHFFDPSLLDSQFASLEEPVDAIVVDGDRPDLDVVNEIVAKLRPDGQMVLHLQHAGR